MLNIIKRHGALSFKELMSELKLIKEEDQERVYGQLKELEASGEIEIGRNHDGVFLYRLVMVRKISEKKGQEFPPVTVSGSINPQAQREAGKLLEALQKFGEEEFTVSSAYKAIGKTSGMYQDQIRSLIVELALRGDIVAMRSKKYMGHQYNLYKVVTKEEIKKKKRVERDPMRDFILEKLGKAPSEYLAEECHEYERKLKALKTQYRVVNDKVVKRLV